MTRSFAGIVIPLALGLGALSQTVSSGQERAPSAADLDEVTLGEVIAANLPLDLEKLLVLWSKRLRCSVVVDPQLAGTKIRFVALEGPLTWGLFKDVLEFHDVVVVLKESKRGRLLFAHARRNLPIRLGPPFTIVGDAAGVSSDGAASVGSDAAPATSSTVIRR